MNNKIVKLALILFLICAVVAGVLGLVNAGTEGIIKEKAEAKTNAAYAEVLSSSSGYTEVAFDKADHPSVDIVKASNDGNGWVVTSTFSGAQGKITMIVGVSSGYECTGISIVEHSETSGLGANAASPGQVGVNFRGQFVGKTSAVTLSDIDALTGATITSRSVTNAVAESIRTCESIG